MAIGEIPPWLAPANSLRGAEAGFAAGVQSATAGGRAGLEINQSRLAALEAGARLASERQRMALQQQQAQEADAMQRAELAQRGSIAGAQMAQQVQLQQMADQVRRDIAQKQMERAQAMQAMTAAYREAQIGLGQGRLEEMQAVQQERAKQAAMQYQAEQGFATDLAGGLDPIQAYARNPGVRPSVISAFTRREAAGNLDPSKRMALQDAYSERRAVEKAIRDYQVKAGPAADPDTMKQLASSLKESQQRIDKLMGVVPPDQPKATEEERAGYSKRLAEDLKALHPNWPTERIQAAVTKAGGKTSPSGSSQAAQKAAKANEIAQQHPDWTREQIIEEVNKQFSQ